MAELEERMRLESRGEQALAHNIHGVRSLRRGDVDAEGQPVAGTRTSWLTR